MRMTPVLVAVAVCLGGGCGTALGQGDKPSAAKQPVKAQTWFNGQRSIWYEGVVEKIDKGGMTVRWTNERLGKEFSLEFLALDIHKEGKYQEYAMPMNSYLWADVKKGDKVSVNTLDDQEDKKRYVTDICIRRRPGGKLPPSQLPKEDSRFDQDSLLNDIDNGEDVTEKEINRVFPLRYDGLTGELIPRSGLPPAYRGKLNTLRDKLDAEKAKKDKDLKATPPEKK